MAGGMSLDAHINRLPQVSCLQAVATGTVYYGALQQLQSVDEHYLGERMVVEYTYTNCCGLCHSGLTTQQAHMICGMWDYL